jgi:hypothetical protein
MNLTCDGFEVETLINVRIAKAGLRVAEVPSYEAARLHGRSNLRIVRDGRRVLATIVRERFPARALEPRRRREDREPAPGVQRPMRRPGSQSL